MLRNMDNPFDFFVTLSFEKGLSKDNIRNMLRPDDKPRNILGHHKDSVKTTKMTKIDESKTN